MDATHILFKFDFNQLDHLLSAYKILNSVFDTSDLVNNKIALRKVLMLLFHILNLH